MSITSSLAEEVVVVSIYLPVTSVLAVAVPVG